MLNADTNSGFQAGAPANDVPVIPPSKKNSSFIELSKRVEFNMHDSYYEHATVDHFWIQHRFETVQKLLEGFELGNRVLEVGCGNGVVQEQFEKALLQPIAGCDLNYRAMEMASESSGKRYLYNVLDRRSEWESHFDAILLFDVLEHIEQPIEFLQALRYHLVDGGLLVINVPATPWLYSRYDEAQGHVRRYTLEHLTNELSAVGFRLAKSTYWGANLLPIAALRKLLLNFSKSKDVFAAGFAPPNEFVEKVMRGLLKIEQRGIRVPNCGTSLAAVVTNGTAKVGTEINETVQ